MLTSCVSLLNELTPLLNGKLKFADDARIFRYVWLATKPLTGIDIKATCTRKQLIIYVWFKINNSSCGLQSENLPERKTISVRLARWERRGF